MKLSVVIPTWRRPASLARCLAGLRAQTRLPDEVLVVVRDTDTATKTLVAETKADGFELRKVTVTTTGVVAALNAGLAEMQGDITAITDDDTVPRPDWLACCESHFANDPEAGGVGGRDWINEPGKVYFGSASTVGRVRWYGRLIGNHHLGVAGHVRSRCSRART